VLDLGAGEGASASEFLRLGARVTAVELSKSAMRALQDRCRAFGDRLELVCADVREALPELGTYDIVIANSFLHHVPDYLSLITDVLDHVGPGGRFFSFQDPLRYDTLPPASHAFSAASYFAWRVFQGNLGQGLRTRIRRLRGAYVAGSIEDDAEYHVTRNGVDQDAIANRLEAHAFEVEVRRYFSTQSAVLQWLGTRARVENTFSIVARRSR
jgi:SAM-dependent methyltransferase